MENLKDFVDDLLPSSYVKVSEQAEEKRSEEQKHTEMAVITNLEEHCLYQFVESLRYSLGLNQEQAFDWHWFFTSKADRNYSEEELLDQGFEVCGFVIQYALLQVKQKFKRVVCSSEARQQLLNLIEVLWVETQISRGYKHQPKNLFAPNQLKKQAVYDFFELKTDFKRDPAPEVELEFPIEEQQAVRQARTREEVFLLLLAQACFIPYPVAFKKVSEDPWLCLQDKLKSAAEEALAVSGLNKKTVLNNRQKLLLYIRLTSHYYADKVVRAGSAAANVQIAKLRAAETAQILQVLKS